MDLTMEYVNKLLLNPLIGLAKSRSLSWPPTGKTNSILDTDITLAFKQTVSCPGSPVHIESEEKWTDEVGGTVTEVHTDKKLGITWRRREFEKTDGETTPSRPETAGQWNGSLYGHLKPQYHRTTPANLRSQRSSNDDVASTITSDGAHDDEDVHDCGIWGNSDCAYAHRCLQAPEFVRKPFTLPPPSSLSHGPVTSVVTPLPACEYPMMNLVRECARAKMIDAKEVVTGVPKRTTRFGEEIMGELYVPCHQHAVAISPIDIHTDPTKLLEEKKAARNVGYKQAGDNMPAITIRVTDIAEPKDKNAENNTSQTSFEYKPVTTPIMPGDSLITRQIKTHGIPVDPLAAPAIAPALPIAPLPPRRPKVLAPKGYCVTHIKPKVVAKRETTTKNVSKEIVNGKGAGEKKARNNITQSLPADQKEKENEKTAPRNYSDPTNKTNIPTTVIEVEEVEVLA
ncbi:hypothetical protein DL98DRAFT_519051 [Cadophora sp. DSE1049]|nr:hypothetical protein DL98DRAFT_519051 [Cadophora sp. DSE1049]